MGELVKAFWREVTQGTERSRWVLENTEQGQGPCDMTEGRRRSGEGQIMSGFTDHGKDLVLYPRRI